MTSGFVLGFGHRILTDLHPEVEHDDGIIGVHDLGTRITFPNSERFRAPRPVQASSSSRSHGSFYERSGDPRTAVRSERKGGHRSRFRPAHHSFTLGIRWSRHGSEFGADQVGQVAAPSLSSATTSRLSQLLMSPKSSSA